MVNILIISHFQMAEGIKNTLSYFNGEAAQRIETINAYVDNLDPKPLIEAFIEKSKENVTLIFSDILGGSVNQYCMPYLNNDNVYLFTGMNLPMLLQATFLSGEESPETIKGLEKVGKEAVVCMNDYQPVAFSEEDE